MCPTSGLPFYAAFCVIDFAHRSRWESAILAGCPILCALTLQRMGRPVCSAKAPNAFFHSQNLISCDEQL